MPERRNRNELPGCVVFTAMLGALVIANGAQKCPGGEEALVEPTTNSAPRTPVSHESQTTPPTIEDSTPVPSVIDAPLDDYHKAILDIAAVTRVGNEALHDLQPQDERVSCSPVPFQGAHLKFESDELTVMAGILPPEVPGSTELSFEYRLQDQNGSRGVLVAVDHEKQCDDGTGFPITVRFEGVESAQDQTLCFTLDSQVSWGKNMQFFNESFMSYTGFSEFLNVAKQACPVTE